MERLSRRLGYAAILMGATALLSGCDTIREAAGNAKEPPDEFAIATKAPLTIPPDYNLHPPKPGAAPTNQVEPTDAAQQALFGADTATIAKAMPGSMSDSEKYLLASANVQSTDPTIRQDIAVDNNKAIQSSSDSFTNSVLFWQKPGQKDEALNGDAATYKRAPVADPAAAPPATPAATTTASATTTPSAAATTPAPVATPATTAPDANAANTDNSTVTIDKKKDDKSNGGWFDWLF